MTTVVTSSLESRARASPRVVARRPRRAFDGRVPDKTNPSHLRAAGTSASSSRARAVSDPREDVAGNPFEQSSDAADERRALFNDIAPVYDRLNDALSLGLHRRRGSERRRNGSSAGRGRARWTCAAALETSRSR